MKAAMQVTVECRAQYGEDEVPWRFWIGTKRIGVEAVLDRWPGPDHRYFKVRGDDRATYILRHDVTSAVWQLVFFSAEDAPPRT
jgi:hypothetical protein